MSINSFDPHVHAMSHRICLEHLQVVATSDHSALVTHVFWRCVRKMAVLFVAYPLQIYSDYARTSINVLVRTRRISWRLGA